MTVVGIATIMMAIAPPDVRARWRRFAGSGEGTRAVRAFPQGRFRREFRVYSFSTVQNIVIFEIMRYGVQ